MLGFLRAAGGLATLGPIGLGAAAVVLVAGGIYAISKQDEDNHKTERKIQEKQVTYPRKIKKENQSIQRLYHRYQDVEADYRNETNRKRERSVRNEANKAFRKQKKIVNDLQAKLDQANEEKTSLKAQLSQMRRGTPRFEETRKMVRQLSNFIHQLVEQLKEARSDLNQLRF